MKFSAAVALTLATLAFPDVAAALSPGDLDPSFGADGVSFYPLSANGGKSQINAVALQPDGKILLGGVGTDSNGNDAFLVARLDANGLLDPTFGDGGKVLVQLGKTSPLASGASSLALRPDGKIVVGGFATEEFPDGNGGFVSRSGPLIARLNSDGSLDSTFGDSGTVVLGEVIDSSSQPLDPGPANAVVVQPDGKIIAGGSALYEDCCSIGLFTRLKSNGAVDPTFGDGGMVKVLHSSTAGQHAVWDVFALALQPNGQILGAGEDADGFFPQLMVARLDASNGSFDSTFGSNGLATRQPFASDEGHGSNAFAVAVQPDGKIVFGGNASGSSHPAWQAAVARITPAHGAFDSAFGNNGLLLLNLGGGASPAAQVSAIAAQPDGRVLIGGFATDSNSNNEALVGRLNGGDGSFDPSFANGGKYRHQFGNGGASEVRALALQPDGNIVAAGDAGSEALIFRLIGQPPAAGGGPGPGQPNGSPPPGGGTPGQANLAVVSKLGISPVAFAAASKGGSIARRIGTTISYRDSVAATTTFTVLKPTRGVRHRRKCLQLRRGRRGKSCTRYVAVGSFRHRDVAGVNTFHFTGRVRNHKLAPGRYQLRAVPRSAGHTGRAATKAFRILQ